MKTQLHFKLIITVLLIVAAQVFGTAQNTNGSKTLNKKSIVPADVTVQLNNHSGDLKINTTGENSVTLKTTVEITGNTKEDADKVISAIENFKFKLNGNTMEIDTRFYKNMNTTNNRTTMTLLNGDKVKIKDFKIQHELQIPASANIELDNKYSDIEMQSIEGNAKFVIYSSKLNAMDFAGDVNIQSKYSKIRLNKIVKDVDFDFYDSDIEMSSCGNMIINSKYSKFEIEKAGNMEIDSYDDKFTVKDLSGLKFTSKYSDFVSEANLKNLKLELYDSNITLKSAEIAVFNGKYSDLKLGDIGNLKIDDSYDNNVYLGNTQRIEIGLSKYSLYEVKSISNLKMDDIYDDNIKIEKLNADFTGLAVNGKYGKMEINAGTNPFKVQFKIKYPKIDIPESVKITKQIKENSDLELVGGEAGGLIKVEGYDMKVVIND